MRTAAATLICVFLAAALHAQTPAPETPDLRPTLAIFKPAKDDDGLAAHAAVGEVVTVPVKSDGLRGRR